MKTPSEFATDQRWDFSVDGPAVRMLEARDAEWRRLVEEAQAETKRVNGELETELRQHAASYDAMRIERDRLKGELSDARAKLEPAERHIRRYHWDAVYSILTGSTPNEVAREQLAAGAPAAPSTEQAAPAERASQETVAYAFTGHGVVEMTDDEAELICECGSGMRLHVFGGHESCEYFEHHCDTCHEAGICTAHVKVLSKLLRMVPAPGVPPAPPVTGDGVETKRTMPWPKPACSVSLPCGGCFTRGICDQLMWESGEAAGLTHGRALGARDERAKLDMNDEDLVADVAFEVGQATKTQPRMGGLCRREHGEVEDRRIARHAILVIARRAGRGTK